MELVEIFNESVSVVTLNDFLEKYRVNLYQKDDKTIGGNSTYNENLRNIVNANLEFLKNKTDEYAEYPKTSNEYQIYVKNHALITSYEASFNGVGLPPQRMLTLNVLSPSILQIPYNLLASNIIQTQGNFQIKDIKQNELLEKEIDKIKQRVTKTLLSDNKVVKKVQKATVLLWSKSFNNSGAGSLLNITPFVMALNTSSTMSGTSISFQLPPITGSYNKENFSWEIDNIEFVNKDNFYVSKNIINRKANNVGNVKGGGKSRFNEINLSSVEITGQGDDGFVDSSNYFFESIISSNDIIFISYDESLSDLDTNNIEVPFRTLKDRNFDIVGLVDTCFSTEVFNSQRTNVTISVSGRDLMKLLIDDNTMFYANAYNNKNDTNIFFNYQDLQSQRSFLRNDAIGSILELADQREYTISYLLNFLISRVSNIQVCPDSLFNHLTDKSYFYKLMREYDEIKSEVKDNGVEKVTTAGIWQMIKLSMDDYSKTKRVSDPSLMSYQGSLMNYVNKVCQKPFVEFFGDTYNDKYLFVVRKPPFDEYNFNRLPQITIDPKMLLSQSLQIASKDAYSWYNLKKSVSLYTQNAQTNFLTAVFFPEFAEIWGAKSLEVTSQYLDDLYNTNSKQSRETYLALLEDFRYMIESTIYLPFTKTGTITVVGDSTYKKGMKALLTNKSEVYYIDSVSNRKVLGQEYDFVTTLGVSRGMKADYTTIFNPEGVSYFNIVEFSEDFNRIGGVVDSKKYVRINRKAFDFFMQRKQFK